MADAEILDVLLHGERIGALTRLSGDRLFFAFDDAYIADARRPTLGLAFEDDLGALVPDLPATRTRAPPFFSNLLPEGRLRDYLAERAGVKPEREFHLLRALGRDLPGAATIRPAAEGARPAGSGAGAEPPGAGGRDGALRFSLAGMQLKFSAAADAAGGLTIPATGAGGSWIVKPPSLRFAGMPENEYATMTLARALGMDVPEVRLVDVAAIGNLPEGFGAAGGRALAVRRFDRAPEGPVHIEDFAQVFGVYPERKYRRGSARAIARVLGAECGEADIVEFVRRLTFSALVGNADMHLKNWSLIYRDRRRPALAPAYDLLSTIPYIPASEAALKFSRTRRFDGFSAAELSHMAARAALPERLVLDAARETVALFRERWRREAANLPLSRETVRAIEAHAETVPLARAGG